MAVELEFLNRGDEAILSYDKAKSIFTRELNCQLPFQSVQPYLVKMPFVDGMIQQDMSEEMIWQMKLLVEECELC